MSSASPAEPCRRGAERGEVTRELSVVERIEEFGAELDRPALRAVKGDASEVFEKGEVPLIPSRAPDHVPRSEEHTSELQSPCNLVCRLLLEKKKKIRYRIKPVHTRPQ